MENFISQLAKILLPEISCQSKIWQQWNKLEKSRRSDFFRSELPEIVHREIKTISNSDTKQLIFKFIIRFFKSMYNKGLIQNISEDQNTNIPSILVSDYPERYFFRIDGEQKYILKDQKNFLLNKLESMLKDQTYRHFEEQLDTQVFFPVLAIKKIAIEIIDFLSVSQDKLARAFEKNKVILNSQYCITLNRLPGNLLTEALSNEKQQAEWQLLYKEDVVEKPPKQDESTLKKFVIDNPGLVIDTKHFPDSFKGELISCFDDIDRELDGYLINSDNFHALNMLSVRFKEQIRCIYIDPPFNTKTNKFMYPDTFTSDAWLTMMANRFEPAKGLLAADGSIYVHIDSNEKEHLKLLLDRYFVVINEIIWRIGWVSGFKTQAKKFIRNHDTIYYCGKSNKPLFNKYLIPHSEGYSRRGSDKSKKQGIPLEDTWNCSENDKLHSIQIMSFSKEKIGSGRLTQKNENLLERMIFTSSNPGDFVLDYFAGSGTTCATAHKMGRKWIGIDVGEIFEKFLVNRMKEVLSGDKYGISDKYKWKGGGFFQYCELESFENVIGNLLSSGGN